jgi:zinc D-Ala-D-Ala carboxypeptidase
MVDLDQKLTKPGNFTMREALRSGTASRLGIANVPNAQDVKNIIWTAEKLELIRVFGGDGSLNITSWFRCLTLNRAIGSKDSSAHPKGLAVDHTRAGITARQWWKRLAPKVKDFGIDQLILEYDDWVHVGFAGPGGTPRHEVFAIGCQA